MDKETIKLHWDLIKLCATAQYLPDQSHAARQAVIAAYGQPVDTSCGACIFEMMERIYNIYKDEFGK